MAVRADPTYDPNTRVAALAPQTGIPDGFHSIARQRQRFTVALVDFTGDGVYNLEYTTRAESGEIIRSFAAAKKLPKEFRVSVWPQIVHELALLLEQACVHRIMRKQPVGTEDQPRHSMTTQVLENAGYALEKSWVDGADLFRIYVRS